MFSKPTLNKTRREIEQRTASRVIVEVAFDVARDDTAESSDEFVNLTRVGTTDGIGDTNTVDTNLVDSTVDGEEVDEVGSERVL